MERHWGLEALAEELALRRGELPPPVLTTLESAMQGAADGTMCLASCFSTKGDVLSQWRAYAENGSGFAIAIDPLELGYMPVTLLEICYDREVQARRISEGIDHVLGLYFEIGQGGG